VAQSRHARLRHAFHAGNHADVLKHLVLTLVLRHMNLKDKGWRYVDTHAGAGGYSLEGDYARKRGEFEHGIARLWDRDDLPAPLADYVALVRAFNGGKKLRQYPGSPALAQLLMRPQDQLRLFELHPTDHKILASYLGDVPGVEVHLADGFARLKAQLPPPTRRGVVLIDPATNSRPTTCAAGGAARGAGTVCRRRGDRLAAAAAVAGGDAAAAATEGRRGGRRQEGLAARALTVARAGERGFGLMGSSVFVANRRTRCTVCCSRCCPGWPMCWSRSRGAGHALAQGAGGA